MVAKGKKNKQMLKIILCILILIIVVYLGYQLYKSITKKSEKKDERYDYIPGLSSESVKNIDIKLKDAFNAAIGAIKDMPLNMSPLCPGSTLARLVLHDGDSCPGVAYTTSGGCKINSPVGCICYERAEAGITKIKGLESLQITDISNLYTNINYKTNECNIIFDMKANIPKVTIYGTAKATFPVCVKAMLGPDDNYLIETQIDIAFTEAVLFGKLEDGKLNLNTSTFQIGGLDVNLKRSDWFSGAPGVIKTVLDNTFGKIGDGWWDMIDSILKNGISVGQLATAGAVTLSPFMGPTGFIAEQMISKGILDKKIFKGIDFRGMLGNAIRGANINISVPYIGLLLSAAFFTTVISKPNITVGDWTVGDNGSTLFFKNGNKSLCFNDTKSTWDNCSASSTSSTTNLPPMFNIGNWIVFAPPKDTSKLIFSTEGANQMIVLDINSGWSVVNFPIIDQYKKIYNSGLNYQCLTMGNYRIINPANDNNKLLIYKSKMDGTNDSLFVLTADKKFSFGWKKWLDLDYDQTELEQSATCNPYATWKKNEWCLSNADYFDDVKRTGIQVEIQGGNQFPVPKNRLKYAQNYKQRFIDWNCRDTINDRECSNLTKKYPTTIQVGRGLSWDSPEVTAQLGGELRNVQGQWKDFSCDSWKVSNIPTAAEQDKNNYVIYVYNSNNKVVDVKKASGGVQLNLQKEGIEHNLNVYGPGTTYKVFISGQEPPVNPGLNCTDLNNKFNLDGLKAYYGVPPFSIEKLRGRLNYMGSVEESNYFLTNCYK
jgi:hypothetical protein